MKSADKAIYGAEQKAKIAAIMLIPAKKPPRLCISDWISTGRDVAKHLF